MHVRSGQLYCIYSSGLKKIKLKDTFYPWVDNAVIQQYFERDYFGKALKFANHSGDK